MRSEVVVKIGHPGFHYIDRGDTVLHRELFFSMISDWRLAITTVRNKVREIDVVGVKK